jgi:hypothetical protein
VKLEDLTGSGCWVDSRQTGRIACRVRDARRAAVSFKTQCPIRSSDPPLASWVPMRTGLAFPRLVAGGARRRAGAPLAPSNTPVSHELGRRRTTRSWAIACRSGRSGRSARRCLDHPPEPTRDNPNGRCLPDTCRLTCGNVARREGLEPPTARSVAIVRPSPVGFRNPAPCAEQRGPTSWTIGRWPCPSFCWICREFVRALERAARALSLVSHCGRQARMLLQDSWSLSRISARLSDAVQSLWDS